VAFDILACFAVKEEAAAFKKLAGKRPEVRTLITGMGLDTAGRAVREALAGTRPRLVLSCGFAGGLRPGLASGTVLFARECSRELQKALESAGARPAKFHSCGHVLVTAAEKRALWQATGADAVEMESPAIAEACRAQAVPCGVVRVVLDAAEEDLPLDFNQLMTPDQQMDYGKLARSVLKSPSRIGGLLRLQRQSKAAAGKLAAALDAALRQGMGAESL
jgi:adenosylhomocysteine nucleosidase